MRDITPSKKVQPELFRGDVQWMNGLDSEEQKTLVELLGKIQLHLTT